MRPALILVAVGALPCAAQENFELLDKISNGIYGAAANSVANHVVAGGYGLTSIELSGTLKSLHPKTWASDSRLEITSPIGTKVQFQPVSGGTYTQLNFGGTVLIDAGTDPAGDWTFRFFEIFDDGGALPDAEWDLTVMMRNDLPTAPTSTDLGVISSPGLNVPPMSIQLAQVLWFRLELSAAVSAASGTYLDIDTEGALFSVPSVTNDTEIALYNSLGVLVAQDDDSGSDFASQLTFGAGARAPVGNGSPYNGRHGDLAPGVYYLALSAHDATFGPLFDAVSTSELIGTSPITIALGDSCYADRDHSGSLDFFDFLCFQNAFAIGEPYADCDNSGSLDFFDFLCFQNAFAMGCP